MQTTNNKQYNINKQYYKQYNKQNIIAQKSQSSALSSYNASFLTKSFATANFN